MRTFLNLGKTPVSNWLISKHDIHRREKRFKLHTLVCEDCGFVQVSKNISFTKLFPNDYIYLSSYSNSWLEHCEDFANYMVQKLNLTPSDLVLEIASNDGYLLQYFKRQDVRVLGIEPTELAATVAVTERAIETRKQFFGEKYAEQLKSEGISPRLIIANNVLAHVPDINDFVAGISKLVSGNTVATFEFPHLYNLIRENQFDTIYHEHYSYLNLTPMMALFEKHGLRIHDVQEITTHGGSLRIFVSASGEHIPPSDAIFRLLDIERRRDPRKRKVRSDLKQKTKSVKIELQKELKRLKRENKLVVVYGAAAKGNTLLNYVGIDRNMIAYAVDRNPNKQSKYLPGSKIEVFPESELLARIPDVILILPWNLAGEICSQLSYLREHDTKFFSAIPEIQYL